MAFKFETSLLDTISVGIVVVDSQYKVLLWNAFMAEHSGVDYHEIAEQKLLENPVVLDPNLLKYYLDQTKINQTHLKISWEQEKYVFALQLSNEHDGLSKDMFHSVTFSPVSLDGEADQGVCMTVINSTENYLSNITLQDALRQLEDRARFDDITGLYDRQYLLERIVEEFNRGKRYDTFFSLLIIDLDDFKSLNDAHGSFIGDEVLKAFAQRLRGGLRNVDIAGRYDGEQFIVLLPSTDEKGAKIAAERIKNFSEKYAISTRKCDLVVTCSVGVAMFNDRDSDVRFLIQRVEEAMLKAKALGKNRVECA